MDNRSKTPHNLCRSPAKDNALAVLDHARHRELKRQERVKNVADILQINTRPESKQPDIFYDSIETYLQNELKHGKSSDFMELERVIQEDYLRRGDDWLAQGKNDKAYAAWRQALKFHPNTGLSWNDSARPKIGNELRNKQKILSRFDPQYLFEYQGSFGKGILDKPSFLLTDRKKNRIIVTDYTTNRVSVFDTQWNFAGDASLKLDAPYGMFRDEDNAIWICEFGSSRLVRLDEKGERDATIELGPILADIHAPTHPAFGILQDGTIYVVLIKKDGTDACLAKIKRNGKPCVRLIQLGIAMSPMNLQTHKGSIYIGDYSRSAVFALPGEGNRLTQKTGRLSNNNLSSIVFFNNALFISAGNTIVKATLENGALFTADLDEITGKKSQPVRLDLMQKGNKQYLLACDFQQACVHKFLIGTK